MIEIEKFYKFLHENPELSGKEYITNLFVLNELTKYDVKIVNIDLSILCFFNKNSKETLALRSELDALEIKEVESNLIKSNNNYMHACGHDIHTSALLKLAKYISLNDFKKNICLIFQSKEESGAGSKQIIDSGVFEKFNITEVIGMHVWPNLEYDKIFSNKKLMFGSIELDIIIDGENNHVSSYNKKYDSTYASYLLYKKLFKINKKNIFHLGKITSGTARNISSNKAILEYSIRFKKNINIQKIVNKKYKTKCKITYDFKSFYPVLNNDKNLLDTVEYNKINTLKSAEDFGYYSTKAKTLYLLYGLGKTNNLHTNNFTTTNIQRNSYYEKLKNLLDYYKK